MELIAQNDVDRRRRAILAGMTSAAALTLFGTSRGRAQPPAKPQRIDVHHHIVSPGYSATLKERGERHVAWSVERSLKEMERSGIGTAVTSLIQPAVWFGEVQLARRLAREANEFAVKLAADHPGRFGTFATIGLPDMEGSLREIEYALDRLRVEGFCLMTSYDGKYLGDTSFSPVLEELNRRSAVVYTHPTPPLCCSNIASGVSVGTIEYATDTTRTMANLIFTGAAARFPNIKWIFSHSGGTTPFLVSRFLREEAVMKDRSAKIPNGVMHELRKFYYDTAQGNHEGALAALLKVAPVSQVLYGTDYPFRDGGEVNSGLASYGFSAAELRAIEQDNALRLMPRLKTGS